MTILCFQLSMPNNNSWNGKWTGDSVFYARTRTFSKKANAQQILDKGYFSYNFGDGWRTAIDVTKVTSAQAKKINKNTKGFCGYEWMIDSIIQHGDIRIKETKTYASMAELEREGII